MNRTCSKSLEENQFPLRKHQNEKFITYWVQTEKLDRSRARHNVPSTNLSLPPSNRKQLENIFFWKNTAQKQQTADNCDHAPAAWSSWVLRMTPFPAVFSSPERRPEPRERYDKAFRANRVYGKPVGNSHTVHGATSPIRPKNILVILAGRKPHTKISMIVNKRSVLSMEQLILDVSKSLGKFSKPHFQNFEIFEKL